MGERFCHTCNGYDHHPGCPDGDVCKTSVCQFCKEEFPSSEMMGVMKTCKGCWGKMFEASMARLSADEIEEFNA